MCCLCALFTFDKLVKGLEKCVERKTVVCKLAIVNRGLERRDEYVCQ